MNSILQAKQQHRNLYLINTEDGHAVVFHIIPWGEFKSFRNLLTVFSNMEEDIKDMLFEQCVIEYACPFALYKRGELTPTDIANGYISIEELMQIIPAGSIENVYSAIVAMSGAAYPQKIFEDIEAMRVDAETDIERRIINYVAAALKVDAGTFDNMEWPELTKLIAQTELLMTNNVPSVPFAIGEKEEKPSVDFEKENKRLKEL